jgi:hypothetical protein
MNKLQTEQLRLFLVPEGLTDQPDASGPGLIDGQGRVRALVMEVAQPAGWDAVASLWQGLQQDLDLPAPAVAVSGSDAWQLWLSLSEALPLAQATDFLDLLRQRYLADVAPWHIRLLPAADSSAAAQARHARLVPALQVATGRWSAFVAPGLAGLFAEEPWLDVPPGAEAQAKLLSSVQSISPADFLQALARLGPAPLAADPAAAATPCVTSAMPQTPSEPMRFLLAVMNDTATEMGLRIEAAKALLPYVQAGPGR